jgi:hypothetical protein
MSVGFRQTRWFWAALSCCPAAANAYEPRYGYDAQTGEYGDLVAKAFDSCGFQCSS